MLFCAGFLWNSNLKSKDAFSKSDPFVVAYINNGIDPMNREIGRTETLQLRICAC